jgi:S1-C subfamily serine protease
VLVAVLLLAAGAWGLTALLGSSGPKGSTTAAGSFGSPAATVPTVPPAATVPTVPPAATTATTATTASAPSRPVDWLGMEIETVAPGAAVIDTVSYGSPGQLAGLEPGDVIVEINNQPIHGAGDIAAAIRGLSAGDVVQMQVSNGSALFNTEVTLAAPPSLYP